MSSPSPAARTTTADAPFRLVDPLQSESGQRWDGLAKSATNATVFHTSAWAKVLAESYRYRPAYMIFDHGNGTEMLLPMMEVKSIITGTRGVSLPFTDYCETLTTGGPSLVELPEQIKEYARGRGWKSIEFRGFTGIDAAPSASYYGHILSLTPNADVLFAGMTGSTRRNVRKAIKEGVEISTSDSEESVKKYYRLHCVTRKRQGVPPQPYSFFRNIHKRLIAEDNGFVVLASKGGVVIAGAVYLSFGKRAMYKFGASKYEYQNLRANSLVMWEAIKKLQRSGFQSLCFGRTDLHRTGLRRFKMGFGAAERVINYHKLDMRTSTFVKPSSSTSERYESIFKAMPVPLLRMAGAILYRHVG